MTVIDFSVPVFNQFFKTASLFLVSYLHMILEQDELGGLELCTLKLVFNTFLSLCWYLFRLYLTLAFFNLHLRKIE